MDEKSDSQTKSQTSSKSNESNLSFVVRDGYKEDNDSDYDPKDDLVNGKMPSIVSWGMREASMRPWSKVIHEIITHKNHKTDYMHSYKCILFDLIHIK